MSRAIRIDYPGAWHHVMNRGAKKAPIFMIREDCQGFLDLMEQTIEKFKWELHAYSLMPNHFHVLIRTSTGNLSKGMQHLLGRYTRWLNRRHGWDGPVFRGRFRSQLVRNPVHLRVLIAYIHLNPVSAHLTKRVDDECWTSYRAYMNKEHRPGWLTTSYFTKVLGGRKKLHEFVESYHHGRLEYPLELEQATGLFMTRASKTRSTRK
jgi:REP element-mobilizing transposase RayT